MSDWSLDLVLGDLHDRLHQRLESTRATIAHPGSKGAASETVWASLLDTHLPLRYQAANAHVVDSNGGFSDQIDVVVFDRQYSPFIFDYEGEKIVPAESVYAIFEAKQAINADHVAYAQEKVASVRQLFRTSLPVPHVDGLAKAKPPIPILGGILTLDSDWKPALGDSLRDALEKGTDDETLDLGCVAKHGLISRDSDGAYDLTEHRKPVAAFLFDLIARLQASATVAMIDVRAYARWLD